ncbi:MAG: hypothetical protein ABIY70_26165 [Capsulimonas sp.]|uniref:hypothetical protein n=1 Tax=Capsulimonas sp. TaxID=2494211 RepID=UPI003264F6CA
MTTNKQKSKGMPVVLKAVAAGVGAAIVSGLIGYFLSSYEQAHDSGDMAGLPGTLLTSCAPFIGMLAAAIVGFTGRSKPG